MQTSNVFFGYPIPNCCEDEGQLARYYGDDLAAMDRNELSSELTVLRYAMGAAAAHRVDRYPMVFTPSGNPVPFNIWADRRIDKVRNLLGKAQR